MVIGRIINEAYVNKKEGTTTQGFRIFFKCVSSSKILMSKDKGKKKVDEDWVKGTKDLGLGQMLTVFKATGQADMVMQGFSLPTLTEAQARAVMNESLFYSLENSPYPYSTIKGIIRPLPLNVVAKSSSNSVIEAFNKTSTNFVYFIKCDDCDPKIPIHF